MKVEYGLSLDEKDYPARHDGADDVLWEPLWRLRTELRPVERALLTCPPLRRLHFLHHGGGSYLSTYHAHSRLQHTLGVFASIAHFCPDDDLLRTAALLHDVGHAGDAEIPGHCAGKINETQEEQNGISTTRIDRRPQPAGRSGK